MLYSDVEDDSDSEGWGLHSVPSSVGTMTDIQFYTALHSYAFVLQLCSGSAYRTCPDFHKLHDRFFPSNNNNDECLWRSILDGSQALAKRAEG